MKKAVTVNFSGYIKYYIETDKTNEEVKNMHQVELAELVKDTDGHVYTDWVIDEIEDAL